MGAPGPETFMKRFQEKLAASRFFTFSLLLHVVIVILGGSVVLFKAYQEPPDFEAAEGGLVDPGATVAQPPNPQDMAETTFTPEAPSITAPTLTAMTTTNMTTPTFQVATSVPIVKPQQTDQMSKVLEKARERDGEGRGRQRPRRDGRSHGRHRARKMMEMNKGKAEERGGGNARLALAGEASE